MAFTSIREDGADGFQHISSNGMGEFTNFNSDGLSGLNFF